ncbi:MAG: DUF4440 domain-containing protein [Kangiellaceae bacterium]|nr:DUF4440 domain-containing protein [Kangiellaceae bacterium]
MKLSDKEYIEITAQEEELWIKESRFNIERMRELMADDFQEFGQSGKYYDLEDTLSMEESGFKTVLPLHEYKLKLISSDVVLATYNSETTYGDITLYARRSSVWCKQGNNWELKFHQGTPYVPNA